MRGFSERPAVAPVGPNPHDAFESGRRGDRPLNPEGTEVALVAE